MCGLCYTFKMIMIALFFNLLSGLKQNSSAQIPITPINKAVIVPIYNSHFGSQNSLLSTANWSDLNSTMDRLNLRNSEAFNHLRGGPSFGRRLTQTQLETLIDENDPEPHDMPTILPRGLPTDLTFSYGEFSVERKQSLTCPRGMKDEDARLLPFLPVRTASDNDNLHNLPDSTKEEANRHFIILVDATEEQKQMNLAKTKEMMKKAEDFKKTNPKPELIQESVKSHLEPVKVEAKKTSELVPDKPKNEPRKSPEKVIPEPLKLKELEKKVKEAEKKLEDKKPTLKEVKKELSPDASDVSESDSDETTSSSESDSSSSDGEMFMGGYGGMPGMMGGMPGMMGGMMGGMPGMMGGMPGMTGGMPWMGAIGGYFGGYPQYPPFFPPQCQPPLPCPCPAPPPAGHGDHGVRPCRHPNEKKICKPKKPAFIRKNQGLNFDFLPHDNCCTEVELIIEPDDPDPLECAINNGIMPIVCCYMPPCLTLDQNSPLASSMNRSSSGHPSSQKSYRSHSQKYSQYGSQRDKDQGYEGTRTQGISSVPDSNNNKNLSNSSNKGKHHTPNSNAGSLNIGDFDEFTFNSMPQEQKINSGSGSRHSVQARIEVNSNAAERPVGSKSSSPDESHKFPLLNQSEGVNQSPRSNHSQGSNHSKRANHSSNIDSHQFPQFNSSQETNQPPRSNHSNGSNHSHRSNHSNA